MNDSEKALDQLKVIRSMMERATVYRALSAPAAIFGGILAVVVGCWLLFLYSGKEWSVCEWEPIFLDVGSCSNSW